MGKGKDGKLELCLDKPVRYCSMCVSLIVMLAGLFACFLVPYFGGLIDNPLAPTDANATVVVAAPAPAPAPSSIIDSSNSTGCGFQGEHGAILGFLLINHGVFAAILGAFLTGSWFFEEKLSMLSGNFGKAITWLFTGVLLLGLGLTFYVDDLGGPAHPLAALLYLSIVGLSFLMMVLFMLRKCCGDIGKDDKYDSASGFMGA